MPATNGSLPAQCARQVTRPPLMRPQMQPTFQANVQGKYRPTVLVVEDNPGLRHFLLRFLEALRYRVVLASDVGEAIEPGTQALPDLILLDVSLPDGTGDAVLSRLAAL